LNVTKVCVMGGSEEAAGISSVGVGTGLLLGAGSLGTGSLGTGALGDGKPWVGI
jgi:hypothetical protein